jgi:hypothetical protein
VALPQNVLSSEPIVAAFKSPRDRVKLPLIDYELGGDDIQDPAHGLRVKVWTGRYSAGVFTLEADDVPAVAIYSRADVVEFSFTFDQNMQPFLAFQLANGFAYYRWFDATVSAFVVEQLPPGSLHPRCALDDKRASQGSVSDIVLAYIRDAALIVREQRDRFDTEYVLAEELTGYRLDNVGMNKVLRFQFKLIGPSVTADPLTEPGITPVLTSLSPSSRQEDLGAFTLVVNGANFMGSGRSTVFFDGSPLATTFETSARLTALVPAGAVDDAGSFDVFVHTSQPLTGSEDSNTLPFTVVGVPTIVDDGTGLEPPRVSIGDPAFSLAVHGTNFTPTTVVRFEGSPRVTHYGSSTVLTADMLAEDIDSLGSFLIDANEPGVGTSNAVPLFVVAPIPEITDIEPPEAFAGFGAVIVTVTGSRFDPTSVVNFNGSPRATSYIDENTLEALFTDDDMATAQHAEVTVTRAPQTSLPFEFRVRVLILEPMLRAATWVRAEEEPIATPVNAVYRYVQRTGTIVGVSIVTGEDVDGDCVIDIRKVPTVDFPPDSGDSIVGGSPPEISSGRTYVDAVLSGWDVAVTEGDCLAFVLESCANFSFVSVELEIEETPPS